MVDVDVDVDVAAVAVAVRGDAGVLIETWCSMLVEISCGMND